MYRSILESILAGFIALLFSANPVFSAEGKPPERLNASSDFPWLVQGLQKFNHPRVQGHVIATPVDWSTNSCADAKSVEPHIRALTECRLLILLLVTADGKYLDIKIVLHESEEGIFLHELSPHFGKYRSWNPVIQVQLNRERGEKTGEFDTFALELVGRFTTAGDKNDWLKGYREERYD